VVRRRDELRLGVRLRPRRGRREERRIPGGVCGQRATMPYGNHLFSYVIR
jgi:hypothetical protein